MRKILLVLTVFYGVATANSSTLTPRWTYDDITEETVETVNLCRGYEYQTCTEIVELQAENISTIDGKKQADFTIAPISNGFHFINIFINGDTDVKGNTSIVKAENGATAIHAVDFTTDSTGVNITWEEVPGITDYRIYYNLVGTSQSVVNVNVTMYYLSTNPGNYEILILPVDSFGSAFIGSPSFITHSINVLDDSIPDPPQFHVYASTSDGGYFTHEILTAIKPDPAAAYHKIYIASTVAGAENMIGDIHEGVIPNNENFCHSFENIAISNEIIFIAKTAVNNFDQESDPTVGYVLFGNYLGNYNDGTPYSSAIVNTADYYLWRANLGAVSHDSYCYTENLFGRPLTIKQQLDVIRNNSVDTKEYYYWRGNLGNSGAGY